MREVLSLIDYMLLSSFVSAPLSKAEELMDCREGVEKTGAKPIATITRLIPTLTAITFVSPVTW
jgi:hypothetical protein